MVLINVMIEPSKHHKEDRNLRPQSREKHGGRARESEVIEPGPAGCLSGPGSDPEVLLGHNPLQLVRQDKFDRLTTVGSSASTSALSCKGNRAGHHAASPEHGRGIASRRTVVIAIDEPAEGVLQAGGRGPVDRELYRL